MVEEIEESNEGREERDDGHQSRAGTEQRYEDQADFGPDSQVSFLNVGGFQMQSNAGLDAPEDGNADQKVD